MSQPKDRMSAFKTLCLSLSLPLAFSSLAAQAQQAGSEVSTNIVFGSSATTAVIEPGSPNDSAIVGTWLGEAKGNPDAENCMPYQWQTERSSDGTLHMVSRDAHTTLLDAKGHWWTTGNVYHEQMDGEDEYSYRYLVLRDGTQVELTLPDDSAELLCNRGRKTIVEEKAAPLKP